MVDTKFLLFAEVDVSGMADTKCLLFRTSLTSRVLFIPVGNNNHATDYNDKGNSPHIKAGFLAEHNVFSLLSSLA